MSPPYGESYHALDADDEAPTSSIAKSVDVEVHETDIVNGAAGQETIGPPVEKVHPDIVLDLGP